MLRMIDCLIKVETVWLASVAASVVLWSKSSFIRKVMVLLSSLLMFFIICENTLFLNIHCMTIYCG